MIWKLVKMRTMTLLSERTLIFIRKFYMKWFIMKTFLVFNILMFEYISILCN